VIRPSGKVICDSLLYPADGVHCVRMASIAACSPVVASLPSARTLYCEASSAAVIWQFPSELMSAGPGSGAPPR
jgi:hypothetical protein